MVSSKFEGKSFQRVQIVKMILQRNGTIPKSYSLCNHNCKLISPIDAFPWRET